MSTTTTTTTPAEAMQSANMTKMVEYSYPTSPNAEKAGYRDGCYTVSVAIGAQPGRAVRSFATKEEAFAFAHTLPMPFHRFQSL